MAQEMCVAGLSVPPGSVVRYRLEIAELADGSTVTLPLLLINGASDGPRLYLGAAIHGDEVAGIAILSQFCAQVLPERLAGSILCVLVQNPLAFQVEHRIPVGLYLKSPLDQMPIDPWVSFPGNPEGNATERLAATLFSLITTCQYAIDIHTPTRGGRYVPIAILPPASLGEAFRRAEDLALAFGSGYLMKTQAGMYVADGVLCVEATRAGVPAFTFEIGEGGRLDADLIPVGVRCLSNALRSLGMLPGAPELPSETVVMTRFVGLRASVGGLLQTTASLGAQVKRGDVLARISNVYGDARETILAPLDGTFVRMTTFPSVATGERVATLGV
ncbi:MAG TPA: succinylglutamate desuccinylase/aspartoacylase family protein [Alphaproteobacteria bacterium]|nr:succinylglutamate desuccinylase/aspartoacylase family protein [Alphaproteobacteria bacterium]